MLLRLIEPLSFPNSKFVAIFYFFYGFVLSVVFTYVHLPDSFFSQSTNFLNVYFMKYSYDYTSIILLPFVCIQHYVLNYGDPKSVLFAILRIFIFAFINYCIGEEFNIIGFFFGACDMYSHYVNEIQCISKGYSWTNLDISGHVFHILYSILVIIEELSFFKNWRSIENKVTEKIIYEGYKYDETPVTEFSREKFKTFRALFLKYRCVLKIFLVLLTVLLTMLHFSIFVTFVYFHTAFEKIVASIFTLTFWYVSYHLIYPICGFKTTPYSVETAEYENLLEKSNEFNLIYDDSVGDWSSGGKAKVFTMFARNTKSYDAL